MSILGVKNRFFDEKMDVSNEIFAPQRPVRGLRMPELYLDRFAELKNGIKVDFGAKIRIL